MRSARGSSQNGEMNPERSPTNSLKLTLVAEHCGETVSQLASGELASRRYLTGSFATGAMLNGSYDLKPGRLQTQLPSAFVNEARSGRVPVSAIVDLMKPVPTPSQANADW